MALVLSLRAGETIFVGDRLVRVANVRHSSDFDVVVEDGAPKAVSNRMATEILPDVFVSAGVGTRPGLLRVVFEAPPSVRIIRSEREVDHVL